MSYEIGNKLIMVKRVVAVDANYFEKICVHQFGCCNSFWMKKGEGPAAIQHACKLHVYCEAYTSKKVYIFAV